MIKQNLNEKWTINKVGEIISFTADMPKTVYQILLEHEMIDDPFYGENDNDARTLSDDDYIFTKVFFVENDLMLEDYLELKFLGLDTIASIRLNGQVIGETKNMHREYAFDVKDLILKGENKLEIYFSSPTAYIEKEQKRNPLWGVETTMDGYEHIRKAHCMFGWDWGPKLPDMGIWRDVYLQGYSVGKLEEFYLTQTHNQTKVEIDLDVKASLFDEHVHIKADLRDHQNKIVASVVQNVTLLEEGQTEVGLHFTVEHPKLWWPNGYGEQYLYNMQIQLVLNEHVIDQIDKKIGLRTMTITRENDVWGETFDYTINGKRIFAMGADYIPEDALITRMNRNRTERLIKDCVKANYNCLRVWGGGFYPSDDFYELCDVYGLIVWEDFMFACGMYEMSDTVIEEMKAEFRDNIRRIRHHACLGLWCGNNEMEWAFMEWEEVPKTEENKADYLLLYEKIIPEVLKEEDPNTFYWPASPSSGGGFDDPNGDNKGDVHYWQVFHGNEHYKAYREHYFRFASEYGMQAFPDYKTVKSYAPEEQRNIFSPIMENHNKCIKPYNGNVKVISNMAGEFQLPKLTEEIVYLSQVFQGEAIKCAVEHLRRNRGRCMGSTYWQVNDNYPVASWASIDYYGRWKAMHYFARRFYAPILVSGFEEEMNGHIYLTNESLQEFAGKVKWQLRDLVDGVLEENEVDVQINPLTANKITSVTIEPYVKSYKDNRSKYLSFQLFDKEEKKVASETILFCPHKYFSFPTVDISADIKERNGKYFIDIKSNQFAKSVGIQFEKSDLVLSDNYFDLLPGESKMVEIEEVIGIEEFFVEELQEEMKVYCVNNLAY